MTIFDAILNNHISVIDRADQLSREAEDEIAKARGYKVRSNHIPYDFADMSTLNARLDELARD